MRVGVGEIDTGCHGPRYSVNGSFVAIRVVAAARRRQPVGDEVRLTYNCDIDSQSVGGEGDRGARFGLGCASARARAIFFEKARSANEEGALL
jgi:hypothetical protein